MSRRLKRRIFCSLVCGGVAFNLLFFVGLLSRNEDLRIYAIIWSISLTIGWIVSAIVEEKTANENENKIIFLKLVILFTVILIILFVTRVILSLSNWDYIFLNISIPFTFAIWLTKWKNN